MKQFFSWVILGFGSFILTGQALAQDWTTIGSDAQRSSWIRGDPRISSSTVRDPEFQLLWKFDFDNEPRQMNALTPPVLLDFYVGYRGFRSLAFMAGSANNVFVVDSDLSRLEWEQSWGDAQQQGESSPACPGGMTTHLTRPTNAALPTVSGFRGFGRRTPAKSAVGEPNEGAVTLAEAGASQFRVPAPSVPSRRRPPAFPVLRGLSLVYALSGDGKLHTLYVSNGEAHVPPIPFLPANAHARGLIVVDDLAYVATTNGCGGVANGVWSLDLKTKKVAQWKSNSAVAGTAGPAFGPDGALYIATSRGEVVKLEPKTLKTAGSYSAAGVSFTSSPVVIDYNDKDYLAVAAKDGSLHLFDAADLSRLVDKTEAFAGPDFVPGALSTWQDAGGETWVLAPVNGSPSPDVRFLTTNGSVTNGAIVAWKVGDQNGAPKLEPGWVSRDMLSPLPPVIVNGVVFAAASGEFRSSDAAVSAVQRARQSKPAVLYALDGANGDVLWDSGDKINSFATGDGLSSGGSKVYLTTYEGSVYAFGFPMEH